ncbi:hypothetical protein BpsM61_00036 [Bacillus phage vB_BpsM-61]|nr:hypothetical protein BpsM61_00036 [Bacillus phage vB_BpsM-61]
MMMNQEQIEQLTEELSRSKLDLGDFIQNAFDNNDVIERQAKHIRGLEKLLRSNSRRRPVKRYSDDRDELMELVESQDAEEIIVIVRKEKVIEYETLNQDAEKSVYMLQVVNKMMLDDIMD